MNFCMYINGELCSSSNKESVVIHSPFQNEELGECPVATYEDCERAIAAAQYSHKEGVWRNLSMEERTNKLTQLLQCMKTHMKQIAEIEAMDIGILTASAQSNIEEAFINFESYLTSAWKINLKEKVESNYRETGAKSWVIREPYGVCGIILPWNYPFDIVINKLVPALLMGNTVVIKPSLLAPCSLLYLGELLEEIQFPKGVINIVSGGDEVGKYLVEDKRVKLISFTGSTAAGKDIYIKSAKTFKKLILECGGNSPFIIWNDVNIKKVIESLLTSILPHSGQVCVASRRVLVHEEIYDKVVKYIKVRMNFVQYIKDRSEEIKLFPIEPMINEEQMLYIHGQVCENIKQGAKIECGGEYILEGNGECFYKPTLLTNISSNMSAFQEEIFGPVLALIKFSDETEVVNLVNSSDYGLTSSIWTEDMEVAQRIARELHCGSTYINTTLFETHNDFAPFGGYKLSGMGREHGIYGLYEYVQIKHLLVKQNE
ncbi:MAG: aldehyde dehydrogenase [Clostridiales bacterium]|nr:aldehyde dehydrogenase [Clostridiales bacterium]